MGKNIKYCIDEIEEIWDNQKPDILFVQELRNSQEEINKFTRNGKMLNRQKFREDIYFESIAKSNEEIIKKKTKENEQKIGMIYNNTSKIQTFKEINKATYLSNNTSCITLHNEKVQTLKIASFEDKKMKRFLALAINTSDQITLLMNIYAPPDTEERKEFLKYLEEEID